MKDKPTSPAASLQSCAHQFLGDVKAFANKEPLTAAAAALGFGVLLNLLPTRVIVGTAAAVAAIVVRPVLLSLGVTKVIELCRQTTSTPPHS